MDKKSEIDIGTEDKEVADTDETSAVVDNKGEGDANSSLETGAIIVDSTDKNNKSEINVLPENMEIRIADVLRTDKDITKEEGIDSENLKTDVANVKPVTREKKNESCNNPDVDAVPENRHTGNKNEKSSTVLTKHSGSDSKIRETKVVESNSEKKRLDNEENTDAGSIPKFENMKDGRKVLRTEAIEFVQPISMSMKTKVEKFAAKNVEFKIEENKSEEATSSDKHKEVSHVESRNVEGSNRQKFKEQTNISSEISKRAENLQESPLISQAVMEEVTEVKDVESSIVVQKEEYIDVEADEQEFPVMTQDIVEEIPLSRTEDEVQVIDPQTNDSMCIETKEQQDVSVVSQNIVDVSEKEVKDMKTNIGSQKINVEPGVSQEPLVISEDIVKDSQIKKVKSVVKASTEERMEESMDVEETEEDNSSQETYCSESSFQRTESTTDSHKLLGTVSFGGVSQATTVDVADLEEVQSSEADMFASQEKQEDTPTSEVSAESSRTVIDYNDFIKGTCDGKPKLMQSSTTLSMAESQDSSSRPGTSGTSLSLSTRKRKHEESESIVTTSKVPRITEVEEKEENVKEGHSKEESSLCVKDLSALSKVLCSVDNMGKGKTNFPVVSPTKVILKEKEIEISPKADRQQYSYVASHNTSRKLNFEVKEDVIEAKKPQFVLVCKSNKDTDEKSKTDVNPEKESQKTADSSAVSSIIDSSPEIEILKTSKSRESIEVVYVSSRDSTKEISWPKTYSGKKKPTKNVDEVVDVEDNAEEKKDIDNVVESSDEELFLRLSPSPDHKSENTSSKSEKSGSHSVSHTSYSSLKSSNASSSSSHTPNEREILSSVRERGCSDSNTHAMYTIQEEEPEKTSEMQTTGSSSSGSNEMLQAEKNMQFSLIKKDIVSPEEDSPSNTDSFTTFSKVKDVAQLTSVEFNQFSVPVDANSQLRISKRKRDTEKEDVPVISVLGSDCESDNQSSPTEVQKKTKTDNGDAKNEYRDSPNTLPLLPSSLPLKGNFGRHSTPHAEEVITPINETSNIERDGIEASEEVIEYVFIKVELKTKYSKQSNKVVYREVQQCEDVTEDVSNIATRKLIDYSSSGGLADVSSKNTSPCSTTSGPGPYTLPSRLSLMSSSSSSSGGSSIAHGFMRNKQVSGSGPFVIPNNPGPKMTKDRSFRSEDVIRPSFQSSFVEGMELLERVLINIHRENSERDHGGIIKTDTGSGKKSVVHKPDDCSMPFDGSVQDVVDTKKNDDADCENAPAIDTLPTPANVLKETPKSSAKPFRGGRTRSSVKKRSLLFSKSKGKENVSQEKDIGEVPPNIESKKGRRTPVRNKSNNNVSVTAAETIITQSPKLRMKESSDSSTRNGSRTPEIPSVMLDENQLKPGASVFARWTDRKYYSGKIKEKTKDGRWIVLFDDGNIKSLVEDFVITVDVLCKGQLVYALAEDEDYLSGVITNIEKKRTDVLYSVELDEGNVVSVTRSSLFMTEDQAKILREMMTTPSPLKTTPHRMADVSLDNVLEGKRSRISGREQQKTLDTPETPSVSGEAKSAPRRKVSSPASSESDISCAMEYVDGVEPESSNREIKSGKVKGQGRSTPRKNDMDSVLGPIPPEGSKIFAGKIFLLTSSDVKPHYATGNDSEGTDNTGTDNTGSESCADYCGSKVPFSKSYLTKQILRGGGELFNRFEDVAVNQYNSCYLITNIPNQTAKFILSLANGIPIVSHTWIIESCTKKQCGPFSKHFIPVGWSLERKMYIWKQKQRPLFRMKIGLVNESKYFLKFWELVLKAAGANVFAITPEKNIKDLKDLHVLVSNHSCPFDIQKLVKELDKPLVSTKWIVQCLITGTKCAFTGHPHYNYDHSLSD